MRSLPRHAVRPTAEGLAAMAAQHAAGGARRAPQRERRGQRPARTGLNHIRRALERTPRDPFAVDAGRAVDAMRAAWGDSYYVTACEGGYEAVRRHGQRVSLTAATPDELTRALLSDSASW